LLFKGGEEEEEEIDIGSYDDYEDSESQEFKQREEEEEVEIDIGSYDDYEDSESQEFKEKEKKPKKVNQLAQFSEGSDLGIYRAYKECPIDLINLIFNEDKKHLISGPLSYRITYNWVNKSSEKIELVDVNQLWKYREHNRLKEGKYSKKNLEKILDEKCSSINKRGFYEPLSLMYYAPTGECSLHEGNHRITWAKNNNVKYVPVRVHIVHYKNSEKYQKAPLKGNTFEKKLKFIAPSEIGFKVLKKDLFHPYFSDKLRAKINHQSFFEPPNDKYILEALNLDMNDKEK
jgi:hypothetical protein